MRGRLSRELVREKGRCRWCGSPVPKGRRSWCSDGCVNQYRLEAWPDEARRAVLDRDHGVCAACGRDCEAVQGRLQHVAREALRYDRTGDQSTVSMDRWLRWKRLKGWLTRFGLPIDGGFTVYSLWHHHHIIPVCRDGLTVLANLQTLCVCCHKAESRKLATDRALTKRATNG